MTSPASVAILLGVAVVLAVVSLLPRADVRHPAISLVRVLLPSWRFFDDLQVTPTLLVRVAGDIGDLGEWVAVLTPPARSALQLVWNPEGNLRLAQHAVLERLLMDVSDRDADATNIEALVSYELVLNLARCSVEHDQRFAGARRFQFKLVEQRPQIGDGAGLAGDDLLISREYAA